MECQNTSFAGCWDTGVDLKISSGLRGTSNILAMASAYNWSSLASSSKAAQVVVTKLKSVKFCNSDQVIFPSLFVSVAVKREAKMPLRMANYFTTMTKNLN